jgi:phosphatidylglycerol:prolipoprotein diacylglycerol transferase
MHPSFYLFGHQFNSYDVIEQIAAVIGFIYMSMALRKLKIAAIPIAIYLFLGIVVQYFGGTLIPLLYRWFYFHQTPWWDVWEKSPGRYFHSVILSMILFTVLYSKWLKWPAGKVLDHLAIALILASSIGRVGCYFQGCCGGKPCDLPWAVVFPRHPELRVHPTQIYMVILESALWLFLLYFNDHKKKYDGQTFWTGVLLYGIYRTGLEFFRTNPVFILGLTHAQVFSIFTVILSLVVLSRLRSHRLWRDPVQRGEKPSPEPNVKIKNS